ncbi:MAG TPA: hypothetical protein DIT05_19415 [Morganella sp. (in: Bacteria)]|nr:hypothetical protein [Morganella sp. (in: enterobacteria)]
MRTEHTRSIQTINHATEVINSFFDDASSKNFSVRRLNVRKDPNRQLFIVTIDNDNKSDDYYIVPFAELSYRKETVEVVVDPSGQYPELNNSITSVIDKIRLSILGYMSNYKKLTLH